MLVAYTGRQVTLHIPVIFPQAFVQQAEKTGASVVTVSEASEIANGVYSTGEIGTSIKEQAMVLKTSEGLAVLTGCSHPGIVNIAKKGNR